MTYRIKYYSVHYPDGNAITGTPFNGFNVDESDIQKQLNYLWSFNSVTRVTVEDNDNGHMVYDHTSNQPFKSFGEQTKKSIIHRTPLEI